MQPSPQTPGSQAPSRANRGMLLKLAVLAAIMFGFGWAMIPLYRAICEVTGVNFLTKRDEAAEQFARNTQVDTSRTVTVEFDANAHGPWEFRPRASSLQVHPGELATVVYAIRNTTGAPSAGQAIPSYAPQLSQKYFRKLECFCFGQQQLDANETREFPVVFVVDPALPADVRTITLSYTFFAVAGQVAPPPAKGT